MSLEEIYHKHKNKVYNLALHYCQNEEDSQEITQDVFLAVHNALLGFREDSTMDTWIYRITINKSLDFLRAKKRQKRFAQFKSIFMDSSVDFNNSLAENNHPGILMEDKEELKNIFDGINTLPDKQKTALILHKIEQKPQAEVAIIMNISVKAVESMVQRAKVNLQKKLNDREG